MTLERWRDLAAGAVISSPGSTEDVDTGSWAVLRPVVDLEKCVHCMICWIFCPDSCFLVENARLVGVDYFHCKGCGICAVECPKKCIEMVEELPQTA
ncbi:MAG: ferredoxin [Chloroflexi bacterium]|nr:ferredoxin [Chloroflexota bacterium]